uniref:Uncharacterized protein n=1 Tax=Micrurus paraensis TaxID=1970185 RepID=A0A2D4KPR8_9SAUR
MFPQGPPLRRVCVSPGVASGAAEASGVHKMQQKASCWLCTPSPPPPMPSLRGSFPHLNLVPKETFRPIGPRVAPEPRVRASCVSGTESHQEMVGVVLAIEDRQETYPGS